MDIYEAAQLFKKNDIPLIIIAGPNYGSGPSRDWAVKGQSFLVRIDFKASKFIKIAFFINLKGIKAVIAESFDDEHRINLLRMGILPLKFKSGQNSSKLGLSCKEKYTIEIDEDIARVHVTMPV